MKIIKSGTRGTALDAVEFTCTHCGCVYTAEENEYRRDSASKNTFYANCPFCHYMNSRTLVTTINGGTITPVSQSASTPNTYNGAYSITPQTH